jgi:hypothetical protein
LSSNTLSGGIVGHQHRIANRLTALQLAIEGIKRHDHLPPREEALVDKAHSAVQELAQELAAERPQTLDR